jgi:hypothetical protein
MVRTVKFQPAFILKYLALLRFLMEKKATIAGDLKETKLGF